MIIAVADTHAVVWSLFDDTRLSSTARDCIDNAAVEGHRIAISPITLVEIIYLTEKGRIHVETLTRLLPLLNLPNGPLAEVPLNQDICQSLQSIPRDVVPEMPDRIIAATALYLGVPVISRDREIRASGLETIW